LYHNINFCKKTAQKLFIDRTIQALMKIVFLMKV
jgi:hypothetical protein